MMRILVLPGDTRFNVGDMAICLAVTRLIRACRPDAAIDVWGHEPELATGFEGVRFVPTGWSLLRSLRRADLVVWGGGQLLQGNRSRVKIPFWVLMIGLCRLFGRRVVGIGQGVGPLHGSLDRALARQAVHWTDAFSVRDSGSAEWLRVAGVGDDEILLAADPAICLAPDSPPSGPVKREGAGPAVGVSLRYTLHHVPRRLIPAQLSGSRRRRAIIASPGFRRFVDDMETVCRRILDRDGASIVFLPMYYAPWETDEYLAAELARRLDAGDRVRIFRARSSVTEVMRAFAEVDVCVATPMHATILATCQGTPTVGLYYEPKGFEYLESLHCEGWSLPLEDAIGPGGADRLSDRVTTLLQNRSEARRHLLEHLPALRARASVNAMMLSDFLLHPTS